MSEATTSADGASTTSSWWDNVTTFWSDLFTPNSNVTPSSGSGGSTGEYNFRNRDGVIVTYTKPPPQHEAKYLTPVGAEPVNTNSPSILESIVSKVSNTHNGIQSQISGSPAPEGQPFARTHVEPQGPVSRFFSAAGNAITGDYTPLEATPSVNRPVEALARTLNLNVSREGLEDFGQLMRALGFAMVVKDHRNLKSAMMLHAAADIGEGYFDTRGAGRPDGLNVSGVLEPYILLASMATSSYGAELAKEAG